MYRTKILIDRNVKKTAIKLMGDLGAAILSPDPVRTAGSARATATFVGCVPGVFGPAAKARSKLRALIPVVDTHDAASPRCSAPAAPIALRARRLPWADLLRRVFAEDVLACPCGGRRGVTAFVTDERLARSLLTALGQPADPAAFAPARDPPQAELAWDEPA